MPFPCFKFSLSKQKPEKTRVLTKSHDAPAPPVYIEKEPLPFSIIKEVYTKYNAELRDISLKLHSYRELAFKERKSAKLLTSFLKKEGFQVDTGIAGDETAFVGTYSQGTGPVISFNAEYDALPGIGQACGHNLIAIASLGAALAAKAWLAEDSNRSGTVKLFGTPAEEGGGGKIDLIKAGFYKDVDISIMSHPTTLDGCFVSTLAIEMFEVEYFGKAAHASAAPWEGINALDAMVQAYTNVNSLRQALLPTMRVHGYIMDGGKAANIIPDYTKGCFIVRAKTVEQLRQLKDDVTQCFVGAAQSTKCKLKITRKMFYKDLKTNSPMAERYQIYASQLGVKFPSRAEQEAAPSGSTDQGNVTYEVPGIHAMYKIETPPGVGNHTPGFEEAAKSQEAHEKTIISSKSLASVAIDFLRDPEFRKQVEGFFKEN